MLQGYILIIKEEKGNLHIKDVMRNMREIYKIKEESLNKIRKYGQYKKIMYNNM